MGWFSRRPDDDPTTAAATGGDAFADDALAPLGRADADWLRSAALAGFTRIGVPGVEARADHLVVHSHRRREHPLDTCPR